jgi:hypothetical protein
VEAAPLAVGTLSRAPHARPGDVVITALVFSSAIWFLAGFLLGRLRARLPDFATGGKWDVVERREDDRHIFYVLVNQRGDQRVLFSTGGAICWYDSATGEMDSDWSSRLEARERVRKLGRGAP